MPSVVLNTAYQKLPLLSSSVCRVACYLAHQLAVVYVHVSMLHNTRNICAIVALLHGGTYTNIADVFLQMATTN